jgi:hypothetical protein
MLALRRDRGAPALLVDGRKVRVSPQRAIGKGGEADVYDIGGGLALKVFKPPDHPDYAADPEAQRGAAERIEEHQTKLPALLALQPGVVRVAWPVAPATDATTGRIAGYAMPLVRPAEALMRYGDQGFRRGIAGEQVVTILRDLHATVTALHRDHFIIGDFNDLNVLVQGESAVLIDADSFQFGSFLTHLFTLRFLDPRLTAGGDLRLARPHDSGSDWYAFGAMVMQLLLFVDPYGGVYSPRNPAHRMAPEQRPLHRITVFHPEVRYPKQALPLESLPDDLLQHFFALFTRDARQEFPLPLLEGLHWTHCRCGLEHARSLCPRCTAVAARAVRSRIVLAGEVACERVAHTAGVFVSARMSGDRLLWLAHQNGRYVREDGSVVCDGSLDPRLAFALQQRATYVTRGDLTLAFGGTARRLMAEAVAVNDRHLYWIDGDGRLMRDGIPGDEAIGSVLEGQTRFWVGPAFGFGFYRAGEVSVAFVFPCEGGGIRDTVQLPPIAGQLVDADAVFTADRCWLLLAIESKGRRLHRCLVIRADGGIEAVVEEPPRAGEWLSRIHGNAAAGPYLFVATDTGVVRVEVRGGRATAQTYADTEEFVDGRTRLLAAREGLIAVNDREIHRLRRQSP